MCLRSSFYVPSEYGEAESAGLGLHCGYVDVCHTDETIERVSDKRGLAKKEVKLYYETTVDLNVGTTKEHIVLVPGTGTSTAIFRRGNRQEHFLGQLIDAGYDVTVFDLRGHGNSSVPPGPYTVDLFGADIMFAVDELFPGQKVHLFGLSVGFGTCMAAALDYPEKAKTLAGNGFLFDRTRKDFAAWFFSRGPVIRLLGLRLVASAAGMAMKERNSGLTKEAFRNCTMDGFIRASSAWLNFNRKPDLPNHNVPTLIILPQYDEAIGHKRKFYEEEMDLMPDNVAKLVYIPGFSHLMLREKTKDGIGAQIMKAQYVEFLNAQGF